MLPPIRIQWEVQLSTELSTQHKVLSYKKWGCYNHTAVLHLRKHTLTSFVLMSVGNGQRFPSYVCLTGLLCKKEETLTKILCMSWWLKITWAARYRGNTSQSLLCFCKKRGRKDFIFFFLDLLTWASRTYCRVLCKTNQSILKIIWMLIGKKVFISFYFTCRSHIPDVLRRQALWTGSSSFRRLRIPTVNQLLLFPPLLSR